MKHLKSLAVLTFGLGLVAAPAAAQDWHAFSRSQTSVYMADVQSIAVDGEASTVRVAIVPRTGAAGDYHHMVDSFAFRCAANQVRTFVSTDYGPTGEETDRFEDEAAEWEEVFPNSYRGFLKAVVCDGERASPPTWPTVRAFVDAGRGGG